MVNLGGMLPYAEIFFLPFLPLLVLIGKERAFDKRYRAAFLLLGLWAFSQICTDIFVGASPASRVKGIARIGWSTRP